MKVNIEKINQNTLKKTNNAFCNRMKPTRINQDYLREMLLIFKLKSSLVLLPIKNAICSI